MTRTTKGAAARGPRSRPGPGRPPTIGGTEQMTVRVGHRRAAYERDAERRGESLTEWARAAFEDRLRGGK